MQLDFSSSNGVPRTFNYILTLHFVLSFKFCADFFFVLFFFTRTRNSKTFIFSTASVNCCCRKKKKMNKQQSLKRKKGIFLLHSNIFSFVLGRSALETIHFCIIVIEQFFNSLDRRVLSVSQPALSSINAYLFSITESQNNISTTYSIF